MDITSLTVSAPGATFGRWVLCHRFRWPQLCRGRRRKLRFGDRMCGYLYRNRHSGRSKPGYPACQPQPDRARGGVLKLYQATATPEIDPSLYKSLDSDPGVNRKSGFCDFTDQLQTFTSRLKGTRFMWRERAAFLYGYICGVRDRFLRNITQNAT